MSEDAAYKRARAATIARQFPALLDSVAAGELHLTGVLMLGPHLTAGNHVELLARARFRTKREIAQLLARIAPYADVPAVVEPIAPVPPAPRRATWATFVEGLAGPYRTLRPGTAPRDWVGDGDAWAPVVGEAQPGEPHGDDPDCAEAETRAAEDGVVTEAASRRGADYAESLSTVADCGVAHGDETSSAHGGPGPARRISAPERNLAPLRYKIQFSASQEYVDLLERARDLLSYEIPTRDLEQVQLRAMRSLVDEIEKRRYAVTEKVRRPRARDAVLLPAEATSATAVATPRDASEREPNEAASRNVGSTPPANSCAEPGDVRISPASSSPVPIRGGRYVPAAVRRDVWERDQGRCSYVDDRGTRCRETAFLELQHREPHARGGDATSDNLCLMCKSHNALAAEHDFGRSFMRRKLAQRRIESGLDRG